VFSGKLKGTFDLNIPGHEVQELGTVENLKTWMEINWGSVLNKQGALAGLMIVQRMRVL
jgi:hypothetical protein